MSSENINPNETNENKYTTAYIKSIALITMLLIGLFIITNSYQLGNVLFPHLMLTELFISLFGIILMIMPTSYMLTLFFNKNIKNISSIDDDMDNQTINIINYNNGIDTNSPAISHHGEITDSIPPNSLNNTFISYFNYTIKVLENKSNESDKKASLLLDNGKFYSMAGIFYFILSIIVWQIYLSSVSFQNHHIYGLISTSVVFIFIEFLSAWYLRQYKSFSDTSTYLTKIKSIFDRYMLIYLISIESSDREFKDLIEQLSSEIKWPETYLLKNADLSFAKEALEAMTTMAQTLKKESQNN